jgi:pyruvate dehydrogenase E1 component subunit alpha
MDFFNCYGGFLQVFEEVRRTSKPVLIEVVTERFRGHSISDPALYRTKEELQQCMERDPLIIFFKVLSTYGMLTMDEYYALDKEQKEVVLAAMKYADDCPWPNPAELEEGVLAPDEQIATGGTNASPAR